MSIVSSSKCAKCKRILGVDKLIKNEEGTGMICIDTESCDARVRELNNEIQ